MQWREGRQLAHDVKAEVGVAAAMGELEGGADVGELGLDELDERAAVLRRGPLLQLGDQRRVVAGVAFPHLLSGVPDRASPNCRSVSSRL